MVSCILFSQGAFVLQIYNDGWNIAFHAQGREWTLAAGELEALCQAN